MIKYSVGYLLSIMLCIISAARAEIGKSYRPEDGLPPGYQLIAREDCGIPGRQPHKVRGGDRPKKPAEAVPVNPPSSYNIADNWDRAVIYRFEGLDPKATYRLRVAMAADPGRSQQILANHQWLYGPPRPKQKGPAASNDGGITYNVSRDSQYIEFDLSPETVGSGNLELRFANRAGNAAVVSLIELWADRPVTLAPAHPAPLVLDYATLEKSVWKPLKFENRPFFFMCYSTVDSHRKGGRYSRFAYEATLQNVLSPVWEYENFSLADLKKWGRVEEWGYHIPVDGECKPDCYECRRQWYTTKLTAAKNTGKLFLSFTGHAWLEPYAALWGADLIATEWGAGSPCVQARLALLRGAARQNHIPFITQTSPWYGGGLVVYEDGEGDEVARPGHSAYFMARTWYLAWLAGAAYTTPEAAQMMFFYRRPEQKGAHWAETPIDNKQPEDQRFKLTPTGLQAKQFVRLINQHQDIGIPYTPFALIMDQYAGFNVTPGAGTVRPWYRLEPTSGDMEMATFLDAIYPRTVIYHPKDEFKESRMMVNAPYGETFDILLSNVAGSVLNVYPAAILLGDHQLTAEFRKTLLAYLVKGGHVILNQRLAGQIADDIRAFRNAGRVWIEEFTKDERSVKELMNKVADRYLPLEVKGDIQYTINRTKNGWLVGLFDNKGAWKEGTGPVLFSQTKQTVAIALKKGAIQSASEWIDGKSLSPAGSRLTVVVPPGVVRIVEIVEKHQ